MINQFVQSVSTHHVETVYFLLFLLFVFVCLFFLASVKNDTDAHTPRHRKAQQTRFDAEVRPSLTEVPMGERIIHSIDKGDHRGT